MNFEDRYELRVPLAQAERGTLWSGRDARSGRPVWVAVLEADAEEALQRRFVEELDALSRVRDPRIARPLEVGRTAEDGPFAVFEVPEGESLETRMKEGPPLRVDQAVRMAADLVGGLAAAHAVGVVHGDVEPGHVFVVERGGRLIPRLVGFGLNRAEERAGLEPADDSQLDSLTFMSPSQARREVRADAASDLYSAVAVLFSLVTGRAPHRGEDPETLRAAVERLLIPPVGRIRPELAGAVGDVIDRALAQDPGQRFHSADALSKALRASLLRTGVSGALETRVGPRSLAADASDEELSEARAQASVVPVPTLVAPGSKGAPDPDTEPTQPSPELPPEALSSPTQPSPELPPEALSSPTQSSPELPPEALPPEPPVDAPMADSIAPVADPDELPDEPPTLVQAVVLPRGVLPQRALPAPIKPPPPAKPTRTELSGSAATRSDSERQPEAVSPEGPVAEPEPAPTVTPTERAVEADAAPIASASPSALEASREEPADADTAAPERPPEALVPVTPRRERPVWIWPAAGLGVLALGLVGAAALRSSEPTEPEPASPASPVSARSEGLTPRPAPSEAAAERATLEPAAPDPDELGQRADIESIAPPEAEPPEPPPRVVLTLTGVPPQARIIVDNNRVQGERIEFDISSDPRRVEIQLAGHRPFARTIPGDRSVELAVELEAERRAESRSEAPRPAAPRAARPAAAPRPPRAGSSAPAPAGTRPSAVRDPGF